MSKRITPLQHRPMLVDIQGLIEGNYANNRELQSMFYPTLIVRLRHGTDLNFDLSWYSPFTGNAEII